MLSWNKSSIYLPNSLAYERAQNAYFKDRVLDLKKSLPMSDYLAQAREYVTDKFDSAVQVRKELGLEQRQSFGLSR